tara:strand:- start:94 stop:381 length:288 start_codon:yes stop_codon:yes gene_type:complete
MEDIYYYNNKPLQLSYLNDYTFCQKIEIIKQIEQDFDNGMITPDQMRWCINNCRFGSFTIKKRIDKLLFNGKIKFNPITNNKRSFFKKKSPFSLY